MNLREFLLGLSAKTVARRARPNLELLENRNLPSTLPYPVLAVANVILVGALRMVTRP